MLHRPRLRRNAMPSDLRHLASTALSRSTIRRITRLLPLQGYIILLFLDAHNYGHPPALALARGRLAGLRSSLITLLDLSLPPSLPPERCPSPLARSTSVLHPATFGRSQPASRSSFPPLRLFPSKATPSSIALTQIWVVVEGLTAQSRRLGGEQLQQARRDTPIIDNTDVSPVSGCDWQGATRKPQRLKGRQQ